MKDLQRRIDALPLDLAEAFYEDLSGNIDALLTVLEKEAEKRNGNGKGRFDAKDEPLMLVRYE